MQALVSIKDLSKHRNSWGLHFGHIWSSQDFALHFLDEVLFQDMAKINDFPFLGDAQVALDILSSCVICQSSYLTWTVPPSPSFLSFLVGFCKFWQESYVNMWGHHGFRIMGNFLRPLNEMLGSTTDILWWYRAYFYGRLCPICYWGWVLVVLFLCTNFRIFDRFVVEEYIFHVDRGPHLF
jgi:hypothetical protein